MNIYQKLNEARTRFHSLELKKTGHNKFAGYNYFELGDFLIPALKVFKEVGLCATVSFDPERAHMLIINVDDPKEMMSIFSPMGSAALKGCHEVQNIGAVETYQRRYLWVAALEIVEHDALDSSEPVKEVKRTGVMADTLDTIKLPPEENEYIRELAENVKDLFAKNGPGNAYDRVESESLEAEHKIVLWSWLPSNVRTALKKEGAFRAIQLKTKEPA